MLVYIVLKVEKTFEWDTKRTEVSPTIVTAFRSKEKAYEFAHNKLLEYLREDYYPENEGGEWERDDVDAYVRDETDGSWKASYRKVVELLHEVLEQTKFYLSSSHCTFKVEQTTLE